MVCYEAGKFTARKLTKMFKESLKGDAFTLAKDRIGEREALALYFDGFMTEITNGDFVKGMEIGRELATRIRQEAGAEEIKH